MPLKHLVNEMIRTTDKGDIIDCDLYIVQLRPNITIDDHTTITGAVVRLGDPFFSAFLPVFDIDNDRLGLALAWQAPDGSAIIPHNPDEGKKVEDELAAAEETEESELTISKLIHEQIV